MNISKYRATVAALSASALLLLVAPSAAGANTQYVDSQGHETNDNSARRQDERAGVGPSWFVPIDPDGILSVSIGSFNAADMTTMSSSVEYSPAGCTGKTDYPHASPGPINPSYASVHGRTLCKATVTEVSTTTVLKRLRWYGMQTLSTDTSSGTSTSGSGDAHPHWYCKGAGTYSYYGYSNHRSVESGKTYTTSTSNFDSTLSRFPC